MRLISLDVLRGLTVAGMILVNSAAAMKYGAEANVAPILLHVSWEGLTLADLVFPGFFDDGRDRHPLFDARGEARFGAAATYPWADGAAAPAGFHSQQSLLVYQLRLGRLAIVRGAPANRPRLLRLRLALSACGFRARG